MWREIGAPLWPPRGPTHGRGVLVGDLVRGKRYLEEWISCCYCCEKSNCASTLAATSFRVGATANRRTRMRTVRTQNIHEEIGYGGAVWYFLHVNSSGKQTRMVVLDGNTADRVVGCFNIHVILATDTNHQVAETEEPMADGGRRLVWLVAPAGWWPYLQAQPGPAEGTICVFSWGPYFLNCKLQSRKIRCRLCNTL